MKLIRNYFRADQNNYQGHVDRRFIDLATHFSRLHDARSGQGGAALAVYFAGEKVVDIHTGKKTQKELWQEDTLSVCYSTGKGILVTLAHILVSHRFLDYDQPIADYWPEFAQHGKEKLSLRHLLSHESGLYDIRNIIAQASEMSDWQHMLKVMELSQPRFEIGSEHAYQALTFGWLVGGAIEKATQRPLQELMKLYLAEPLELDGAYFGVPEHEIARVAKPLNYQDPEMRALKAEQKKTQVHNKVQKKHNPDLIGKAIELSGQNPEDFLDAMVPKGMARFSFFDDATLQTLIPAANGVFTARSLAKIYAMLAQGGRWNNVELIDPVTFKSLSTIQNHGRDRVMPIPMKWRLGYHRVLTLGKRATQGFGHIGYNGSGAWCDPERQLSFAYTHNFPTGSITGDYRLWGLSQETLRCADQIIHGKKGWF